MKKKKTAGFGFTLIEFIISVAILGIIFAISARLLLEIADGWRLAGSRNEISETAKVAMGRMTREIRMVKDRTSVLTASGSVFQFIDANSNNIQFNVSSGRLLRTENGAANALADNVSSLSFTYYNSLDAAIPAPAVSPSSTDIRRIVVDITFSAGGAQLSFESGISLRRLE